MLTPAYMGTQEWLILAGLAVLLFGGAKLPQLAKGLGEGIREFKKSVTGDGGVDGVGGDGDSTPASPEPETQTKKDA
jgi:sec-independent protein translocase protein TatA